MTLSEWAKKVPKLFVEEGGGCERVNVLPTAVTHTVRVHACLHITYRSLPAVNPRSQTRHRLVDPSGV